MNGIGEISKFCAPLIALMVLVSSMSYTIDFHYCQGQLKSFNIFGKAKNCHELSSKMPTCHKKMDQENYLSCSAKANDCCNNKTVHVESEFDEKILNVDYTNFECQFFVGVNTDSSFKGFFGEKEDVIPFAHYKPPLIQRDIPVLFDAFLL